MRRSLILTLVLTLLLALGLVAPVTAASYSYNRIDAANTVVWVDGDHRADDDAVCADAFGAGSAALWHRLYTDNGPDDTYIDTIIDCT